MTTLPTRGGLTRQAPCLAALLVLLFSACSHGGRPAQSATPDGLPGPTEPLPRQPTALADRLTETTDHLRTEIDGWGGKTARPPEPVTLLALHQQRIVRLLAARPRLARRTIARMPR